MKKRVVLFFVLATLLLVSFVYAAINVGTIDGYVLDEKHNNATVSGAYVKTINSGCNGNDDNCNDTSESTGYYIIPNLGFNVGDTLTVYAFKENDTYQNATGTVSATASALFNTVNVTICGPPFKSSLNGVTDISLSGSTTANVTFTWTKGTDEPGFTTYSQFKIDGGSAQTVTSGHEETGLSIGSHTWQVRTCNDYCCSDYSSDSFSISNDLPTSPTLVTLENVSSTGVTFDWSSGTDSEPTFDQYQINSGSWTTATPVVLQTLSGFSQYTWRVRTCETNSPSRCSGSSSDSFILCESSATTTNIVASTPGSSGGSHTGPCSINPQNFIVEEGEIYLEMNRGDSLTKTFRVGNALMDGVDVSINQHGLKSFMDVSETNFHLPSGQGKSLKLFFFVPEDTEYGSYLGNMVVFAGAIKKEVQIIIDVVSTAFELETGLKKDVLQRGENLVVDVDLVDYPQDVVRVEYTVKNSNGKIVYDFDEVTSETSFRRELPYGFVEGKYFLTVLAEDQIGEEIVTSTKDFVVIEPITQEGPYGVEKSPPWVFPFTLVQLLVTLSLLYYIHILRKLNQKERQQRAASQNR